MKFFEDFAPGQRVTSTRKYCVSEAEIIEFATQWDPQPFHVDPEAARQTEFGRVFASALHTQAITTKLAHECGFYDMAMVAGFGVDEMRTPKPVFGGDELDLVVEVVAVKSSASRPHQGIVTFGFTSANQAGEVVMTYRLALLLNRR
ncbi:MaoC family dehydratase N-terminal domain-containing protein [Spongiibacter taiwanensis]|uniref:MaoC/PaaZ C-terminal domain-containing protein n=1 Tax=Spongiibacter taiwanensis TaxID=1748242 RepID=UPI002035BB91|nr:MaoC/PaaZ C-terminal domain-containing protein [Spongiibacter taiwanensis]USA43727.1 MaoC family dehydratase N-terminal domain-containing protein [Spongiibacter taiwanensis]